VDLGYANLACAFLRAAGIPAKPVIGGVLSDATLGWAWPVPEGGARRWWILVYYPDRGWVPSDPYRTTNWVDSVHLAVVPSDFGLNYLYVTRTDHRESSMTMVDELARPDDFPAGDGTSLLMAGPPSVKALLQAEPSVYSLALDASAPVTSFTITLASRRCNPAWQLTEQAEWITPSLTSGSTPATVEFTVDASALEPGWHQSELLLSTADGEYVPYTRSIPIHLILGDPLQHVYMPLARR